MNTTPPAPVKAPTFALFAIVPVIWWIYTLLLHAGPPFAATVFGLMTGTCFAVGAILDERVLRPVR